MDEIKALVFNTKTRYNIILGSDFLLKLNAGININYVERNLSWFGISIPLRDPFDMTNEEYLAMADAEKILYKVAFLVKNWRDAYIWHSPY